MTYKKGALSYVGSLEALLETLADSDEAGICFTDMGQHCVYCGFHSRDFDAEVKHEPDCPIAKARRLLKGRQKKSELA